MKKSKFFILSFVILPIFFLLNCESESSSKDSTSDSNSIKNIIGTWDVLKFDDDGTIQELPQEFKLDNYGSKLTLKIYVNILSDRIDMHTNIEISIPVTKPSTYIEKSKSWETYTSELTTIVNKEFPFKKFYCGSDSIIIKNGEIDDDTKYEMDGDIATFESKDMGEWFVMKKVDSSVIKDAQEYCLPTSKRFKSFRFFKKSPRVNL